MPTPDRWHFLHTSGEEAAIASPGLLRANDAGVMMPTLRAWLSPAVQPEVLVWEDLAAGRLEVAMTDWFMPAIALNIITPPW